MSSPPSGTQKRTAKPNCTMRPSSTVLAAGKVDGSGTTAPAELTGSPVVAVALTNVPAVFEQSVDEVNIIAPAQSSFDGGGGGSVIQILKVPEAFGSV